MNRLQLPHAKLFYIISEMYKKTLISDDEKRILKCKQLANAEKAISDDLQIFQVLDKYERTKSEEELEQNLINLVKGKGFNLILNEVSSTKHHDTASSQEPVQQQQAKPDEQHEAHPTNPIFTNPSIPDEVPRCVEL
jgi:hypothetical protein